MKYFMVLEDGTTYTQLAGCKIVALTDEAYDKAENGDSYEPYSPDLDEVIAAVFSGDYDSLSHYGEKVDPNRVGQVIVKFNSLED